MNAPDLCNDSGLIDLASLEDNLDTGTWEFDTPPGVQIFLLLTEKILKQRVPMPETYYIVFTLDETVPAGCEQQSEPVEIMVYDAPFSGMHTGVQNACNAEDTSIDLASLIDNEDTGVYGHRRLPIPSIPGLVLPELLIL